MYRKGFTPNALIYAKHEHIDCFSLLSHDAKQRGFSIGDWWYGVLRRWIDMILIVHFNASQAPIRTFNSSLVKWEGKPVINWFLRELFSTYGERAEQGPFSMTVTFESPRILEIEGAEHEVKALTCSATRLHRNKRKWVSWTGDAFFDWNAQQVTVAAGGMLLGSAVDTDIALWEDFEGEVPPVEDKPGFIRVVMWQDQQWDESQPVPDIMAL